MYESRAHASPSNSAVVEQDLSHTNSRNTTEPAAPTPAKTTLAITTDYDNTTRGRGGGAGDSGDNIPLRL